ncbi:hypothetical protein F2P79_020908 [Pimephales promelas]|nr:hypothetical protein F2P79_020907 [Pimephales promelas]KAG1932755.1 hypothetical protein F2P79_020908 [Pimephales promelas]
MRNCELLPTLCYGEHGGTIEPSWRTLEPNPGAGERMRNCELLTLCYAAHGGTIEPSCRTLEPSMEELMFRAGGAAEPASEELGALLVL